MPLPLRHLTGRWTREPSPRGELGGRRLSALPLHSVSSAEVRSHSPHFHTLWRYSQRIPLRKNPPEGPQMLTVFTPTTMATRRSLGKEAVKYEGLSFSHTDSSRHVPFCHRSKAEDRGGPHRVVPGLCRRPEGAAPRSRPLPPGVLWSGGSGGCAREVSAWLTS